MNRKLPDVEQISYLWLYPGKIERIMREYRRLYPTGRLAKLFWAFFGLALVLLVGCAWALGFFRDLL